MTSHEITELHSRTHLVRHASNVGARDQLYQRAKRGEVIRVLRGCYVEANYWSSLGEGSRHRAKAHLAQLAFGDDLVFSHLTAAALWRLPILGRWPNRVEVAGMPGRASHRSATLARHAFGIQEAHERAEGLRLTPLAVTVAQVAAAHPFANGVVVADAALRRATHPVAGLVSTVTPADLVTSAAAIPRNRGGVRALSVAEFADGRADRPGESMSRVSIRAAGLAMPQLQTALYGATGLRYFGDFYWPSLRLIGEFDGKAKYSDPVFLHGRTPEQALLDEKSREDDLRAAGYRFCRWGWDVALSPIRLGALLRNAGVR